MDTEIMARSENGTALTARGGSSVLATVPLQAQGSLLRMFADPYLLDKAERADLVAQLRESVVANPQVPELRVLFGMALCVNFEVPDAIEELRVAVELDPQSFIAQLKMGELWMRLRVMDKAEEHTRQAALLAQNLAQSELARRQAASIRAMKQAGIERGTYNRPGLFLARLSRLWTKNRREALAAVDVR